MPSEPRESQPRSRSSSRRAAGLRKCSIPSGHPIDWSRVRHPSGPPPCGGMASQVPSTPTEKIRRYDKPVRILAGLYHRHCSGRWKHRRDGDLLPCSSVWASPDLAHEPSPRIHILLGRALRAVHGELRQCLSAAWCRSTPPCSKGVRDEKMLEKLVTRDVDNVTTLFALTDKCARATEGRAWHSAPQAGVTQTAVPAPSPRTVSRRKRETRAAVARINGLLPRSSMPWLGAKVSATSAHGPRKAAATHARCTPTVATVSLTAGRLSS
jgi:hypothetical protein